jgi:hypothetical protein
MLGETVNWSIFAILIALPMLHYILAVQVLDGGTDVSEPQSLDCDE